MQPIEDPSQLLAKMQKIYYANTAAHKPEPLLPRGTLITAFPQVLSKKLSQVDVPQVPEMTGIFAQPLSKKAATGMTEAAPAPEAMYDMGTTISQKKKKRRYTKGSGIPLERSKHGYKERLDRRSVEYSTGITNTNSKK